MGCTVQKKPKQSPALSSQQQQSAIQETQLQSSTPKNEYLIIETPSQTNLRVQRLKHVREIIMSGYSNSPKNKITRKQSDQISQI